MAADSSKKDPRIQKTKTAIYDALYTLLARKPLGEISVTELSEMANINRKTFYAHYTTVNDIVDEITEDTSKMLSAVLSEMFADYEVFSPNILFMLLNVIMNDEDYTMKSILLSPNGPMLLDKLKKVLQKAILEDLLEADSLPGVSKDCYPMIAAFLAGGLTSIYYEWETGEEKLTLNDVSYTLSNLMIGGLRGFSKSDS